jgi:hypothetical protein
MGSLISKKRPPSDKPPQEKSEPEKRVRFHPKRIRHRRDGHTIEAIVTQIETESDYCVYKLERGCKEYFVYLKREHHNFSRFHSQLQIGTVHRCRFVKTTDLLFRREKLPVHQLLMVNPVMTTHVTCKVEEIKPVSSKWAELILKPRPLKVGLDSWYARILVPVSVTVPLQVPVDLSLEYAGGFIYRVVGVTPIQLKKIPTVPASS